jgi:hypothetical protein
LPITFLILAFFASAITAETGRLGLVRRATQISMKAGSTDFKLNYENLGQKLPVKKFGV